MGNPRGNNVANQQRHPFGKRRRRCLGLTLVGVAILIPGCQATGPTGADPTADQVAFMKTEPSITNIAIFWDPYSPWIWNEDKSEVRGIKAGPLYLLGPKGLGAFGDGIIRPRLYRLEKNADGKMQPILVKEWSLTVEEAIPYRMKSRKALGWGYGLRLPLEWEELNLPPGELRLVVAFERNDGYIVTSSKKDVPNPYVRD